MTNLLRERCARAWRAAEESADWGRAVIAARTLVQVDPLDEAFVRHLMWALAMSGHPEEARAACVALRARRSAMSPESQALPLSDETESLLVRIEAVRARGLMKPRNRQGAEAAEPPLFGRRQLLEAIRASLSTPVLSGVRTVVLEGESGIGKTRLAEEILRSAALAGYSVLQAESSELERHIPLNLLAEALAGPEVSQVAQRLHLRYRRTLADILPRLAPQTAEPQQSAHSSSPTAAHRRLCEAALKLFESLGEIAPVVLFLDNFHWADESSVAVLEFIRRRLNSRSAVFMLAVRPEQMPDKSPARRFLNAVRSTAACSWFTLGELPPDAQKRLVDHVTQREIPSSDLEWLQALAGGNPFFLIELAQQYVDGDLKPSARLGPGDSVVVPMSVQHILGQKVATLNASSTKVLEVLAVSHRPLTARQVAAIGRLPVRRVLDAVDHLCQVRLCSLSGSFVSPRHELVRQTVYRRLNAPRRSWLHERLARFLVTHSSLDTPDEIAIHADRAGMRAEACQAARAAANRAEKMGAVSEAIRFLHIALRNTDDQVTTTHLLGKLAELTYLQLRYSDAGPLLQRAAERYSELGLNQESLMARVRWMDVARRTRSLPASEILRELRAIRSHATTSRLWEVVATALDAEVHLLDQLGDIAALQEVFAAAEECITHGSSRARCIAHRTCLFHQYYGDPDAALRHCEAAVDIATNDHLADELVRSLNGLLTVMLHQGLLESEAGQEVRRRALQVARSSGDLIFRNSVMMNVGVWYLDIGEIALASRFLQEAARDIMQNPAVPLDSKLLFNLGELALETHDAETARQHFGQCLEIAGDRPPWYVPPLAHAGLGMAAIYEGRLKAARQHEEVLTEMLTSENIFCNDPVLIVRFQARMCQLRGNTTAALQLLDNAAAAVKDRFIPNWLRLQLDAVRARFSIDPEEARKRAAAALEVATGRHLRTRALEFRTLLDR